MTDLEIPVLFPATNCWCWSFSLKPRLFVQGKSADYAIFGQRMQGWKRPPQRLSMIPLYCKHCTVQSPITILSCHLMKGSGVSALLLPEESCSRFSHCCDPSRLNLLMASPGSSVLTLTFS